MLNNIDFTIEKWCAWAPGVESQSEWLAWANNEREIQLSGSPDVKFVPAMLRRRLSLLSRMALFVANGCLLPKQTIRTVFCSQHGELHRTVALLQSIVENELVSPMAFSLSVPNTAAGLYSISQQDTSASTTLSAGADSFEHALIEAAMLIKDKKEEKVLLVCCEQLLPEVYNQFAENKMYNFGLALLLGLNNKNRQFNLSFTANNLSSHRDKADRQQKDPRALSFLRHLILRNEKFVLESSRLTWKYLHYVN